MELNTKYVLLILAFAIFPFMEANIAEALQLQIVSDNGAAFVVKQQLFASVEKINNSTTSDPTLITIEGVGINARIVNQDYDRGHVTHGVEEVIGEDVPISPIIIIDNATKFAAIVADPDSPNQIQDVINQFHQKYSWNDGNMFETGTKPPISTNNILSCIVTGISSCDGNTDPVGIVINGPASVSFTPEYLADPSTVSLTGKTDGSFTVTLINDGTTLYNIVNGTINHNINDLSAGVMFDVELLSGEILNLNVTNPDAYFNEFLQIEDLDSNAVYQILRNGDVVISGMTTGDGKITLYDRLNEFVALDGIYTLSIFQDATTYRGSFSTVVLDHYNNATIHIPTIEDRIYIAHTHVAVPVVGNITMSNFQLNPRNSSESIIPISYLDGDYNNEPVYVPVVPRFLGFNVTVGAIPITVNYADVINPSLVQIAVPSTEVVNIMNETNPITYVEATTGTVAHYIATSDTINLQILLSMDGSLEIENSYLGCALRPPAAPDDWDIRDPLNAWAEVWINGKQQSFNGTDQVFLGKNEFPIRTLTTPETDEDILARALGCEVTMHTIDDLEEGEEYKVRMRGRFNGNSGPWSNDAIITTMQTNGASPSSTIVMPSNNGDKDIGTIILTSKEPGVINMEWVGPVEKTRDYRISFAKSSDNWPSWTDPNRNDYPAIAGTLNITRNTSFEYPTFPIIGAISVDSLSPGDIVEFFIYAQIDGGVNIEDKNLDGVINEKDIDVTDLDEDFTSVGFINKIVGTARAEVKIISASFSVDQ